MRPSLSWPVLQGETQRLMPSGVLMRIPSLPYPTNILTLFSYQPHLPCTQPGALAHRLWPLPCSVPPEDPSWPHSHLSPVARPRHFMEAAEHIQAWGENRGGEALEV